MNSGAAVLRRTVTRNLRWLIPGTVLTSLHQVCEAAVPVLIGVIVDRAVGTGSVPAIIAWIAMLAALFLVLSVLWRFGSRLLMYAVARESHLLRIEISGRLLDPLGIRTDFKAGELLSISSTDADETGYVIDYLPRVAGALVATVVCGIVLLSIDLPLGLIVLIGIPLVVSALQLSAPLIARRVEEQQAEVGRATALATDLVSGHRPLQGIGAQANAAARYRVASRTSLAATLRAARIESVQEGVATAVGALAAMTIALAAAYFALHGELSLGQLITVIGLAQFLIEPFSTLAIVPSWVAEARASANRVAAVLDSPTLHSTDPATAAPEEAAPPGTLTARLEGWTLQLQPGECVAVLTADARDATSLIDVLSGRVRSTASVHAGGHPIGAITPGERRHRLLVEHHNGELFTGTVESNLRIGAQGRDAGPALAASCAVDVVELHPDGLSSPILERGASLSGGQRQRLTLARALAADPDILVLHDPTTAVDAVTEQAIADGIRRLRPSSGRTTLIVTSSPALLATADRVVVVTDGQVRVEGTHRDLVDSDPVYRKLVSR
ncbi:ABC transporter ATP-binding protein [Mycobacterium sp. 48b]|uniref:ABC transporter ATP-binding protein n=1 Tax=Mycobacterium sp. 48b TaxID=3400426 RepID=UPI003AAD0A91